MNHLSWAQILNVPTGLFAIQGADEYGKLLRQRMEEIGVSTEHIIVDDSYHTSVSHIFIDTNSNHHTYMFRGATSFISPDIVEKYFIPHLDNAKIVTSEISQVPLASVRTFLEAAGKRNIMRFLDMDLPCSVAIGPANLGCKEDLDACLYNCEVLKVNQGDVPELFPELDAQMLLQEPPSITAERITDRCPNARFVAVTKGDKGAGLCVRGQEGIDIQIIEDVISMDDTGAGDAFLGGLIAGLYHWGMPETTEAVKRLGQLGSLTGAVCCQQFGTLPDTESVMKMTSLDNMNIVKDLFLVNMTSSLPEEKKEKEEVENAIVDSFRRDKNNIKLLMEKYDERQFERVAEMIIANHDHGHKFFITGEGKSGTVGRRMATSLTSLGMSSQFVPAVEWLHGDLGHLSPGDCVLLISHSGKNADVMNLIDVFKRRKVVVLGMCADEKSPLLTQTDAGLFVPADGELLNCIPTRSVISQEAAVNALMSQICAVRGLGPEDFLRNHPATDIIKADKKE